MSRLAKLIRKMRILAVRSALLSFAAIAWLLAGFMSRPIVEDTFHADIRGLTGVEIHAGLEDAPKQRIEIPAEKTSLKTVAIAFGPDMAHIITIPEGLKDLAASGATHIFVITIEERQKGHGLSLGLQTPDGRSVDVYFPGATKCSYRMEEVPQPPKAEEDGF